MEMMMSSILSIFDEALSLTNQTYDEFEARQIQEALQDSLSLSENPSSSSPAPCEICTEDKDGSDMFDVGGCGHSFCAACVSKHVEYKLRDGDVRVTCPNESCSNLIEPRSLRGHVAAAVLDRWEEALAESAMPASERVVCPYGDCAEVLVNDGGVAATAEAECPWCHRLMCARCKVTWHEGLECGEYRRERGGKREKEGLRRLAMENKWKKCPNCRVFVDKIDGCIHVTCRWGPLIFSFTCMNLFQEYMMKEKK